MLEQLKLFNIPETTEREPMLIFQKHFLKYREKAYYFLHNLSPINYNGVPFLICNVIRR